MPPGHVAFLLPRGRGEDAGIFSPVFAAVILHMEMLKKGGLPEGV